MTKGKKNNHNKGKGRKKGGERPTIIRGKKWNYMNATSDTGIFVLTRWEIDTDMLTSWALMAQMFQFWRIKSITFQYIPAVGTSYAGNVYMCILEDVASTSPSNADTLMENQHAKVGMAGRPFSLHYKPSGPDSKWLYTKDPVLASDDRWEMPGDFCYATAAWTVAQTPGYIITNYCVEFKGFSNNSVASPNSLIKIIEDTAEQKIEKVLRQIAEDLQNKNIKVNLEDIKRRYNIKAGNQKPVAIYKEKQKKEEEELTELKSTKTLTFP